MTLPPERLALMAPVWSFNGTSCQVWLGCKNDKGYGVISIDGERYLAHRVAYEAAKGPIPDGLVLDHLCRNPPCVNPDHLEAVTLKENTLRGIGPSAVNARKTHCIRGHRLADENLYFYPSRGGDRQCRKCGAQRKAKARRIHPAKRKPKARAEFAGQWLTAAQIARILDVSPSAISHRVLKGQTLQEAFDGITMMTPSRRAENGDQP